MRKEYTASSTRCRSEREGILVVAPNWLGDAVMATPFLMLLRKMFDKLAISVFCRGYVSEIFSRSSAVDNLIVCNSKNPLKVALKLHSMKPKKGWMYSFVLPDSFFSALVSFISGARTRVGYSCEMRDFLLSKAIHNVVQRGMHLSRIYIHILETVTGEEVKDIPRPVVVPPYEWQKISSSFCGVGRYVAIAPGAMYGDAKRWPLERFRDLAVRLASRNGLKVVIVGSKKEREAIESAFADTGATWLNLAGKTGVAELLSVVRAASLFIGNDSGVSHIAAAMGIPTVSIFGSTSPTWTAPMGPYARYIYKETSCSPCFARSCPRGEPECLLKVEVEEVFETAESLLGKKGSVDEER